MSGSLRGVALTLEGPLQAWGGAVVGDNRPTLPFPTRSGVLGLLAASLGIRRHDHVRLHRLAEEARVHIRVDAPGTPLIDDQTIQGLPRASKERQTIQSKRTYLCDASFTAVVVPGTHCSVEELAGALRRPVFAPFLGRRCCVPSKPLLLRDSVEATGALGLFDALPSVEGPRSEAAIDFYLDGDGDGDGHGPHPILRRLHIRDDLSGSLPRTWRERVVAHVRVASHRTDRASGSDPIDDWMPQ